MSRMIHLMDLSQRYHWSKGVRECGQEEGVLGNLAPPGNREESASHHIARQRGPLSSELSRGPLQTSPNAEIHHNDMLRDTLIHMDLGHTIS